MIALYSIVKGGVLSDRTSFQLSFSDVRSLYPHNGISNNIIDFFIRYVCKKISL